ncbi:MAG: maleylpyruvate isomerase family mycothiol-dependent enzyme [Streptosporangiales bacterium]|nr:maleylpyruvate isomerase family mycothiol-dependent enzyme [Streptosporangiales bacterium]
MHTVCTYRPFVCIAPSTACLEEARNVELSRTDVTNGLLGGYESFARLIGGLTPEGWRTRTRCTGWEARDVAGHVVGQLDDVLAGTVGGRTPDEQAEQLRYQDPATLADRLRGAAAGFGELLGALDDGAWAGPSGVPDVTIDQGVRALWFDTYVHADDIHAALGLPSDRGEALRASVVHLRDLLLRGGWGPARLALDGMPELDVGDGGPVLRGDPLRFLLVGTGRADPAEFGLDESVNIYRP